MNTKVLIGGIVAVVALVALLPLLSGGYGGSSAPAPAGQNNNATGQQDRPQAAPAPQAPAAQAPAQLAPSAPAGAPNLTARDLENTTWQIQGIPITLLPNGVAQANIPGIGQIQGNWNVSGNQLNVSAMGQSESAEIRGNQLFARGQPLQRVR